MGFDVREGRFGDLATLQLTDPDTGATAVLAPRGATLLSWHPAVPGIPAAGVVDGYRDEAEFAAQAGVRNGLMAPFSNRIRAGRYRFDGAEHDLLPGVAEPDRLVYHGFLRLLDCDAADVATDATSATVRLTSSAIRPGAFDGYPFALDLDVTYRLTAAGLTLRVVGHNVGDRAAPYGCGWHPYFRLGSGPVDTLELHVPARTAIRTDEALIPLAGERARQPIDDDERPTFERPRPIGPAVIDAAYTDLVPDPDGLARTVLRDPATGVTLTVWQPAGLMHVFTGDTLDRDRRASIALEPVELMTDAFNRPECAAAVALAPDARRTFDCGVEVAPAP